MLLVQPVRKIEMIFPLSPLFRNRNIHVVNIAKKQQETKFPNLNFAYGRKQEPFKEIGRPLQ